MELAGEKSAGQRQFIATCADLGEEPQKLPLPLKKKKKKKVKGSPLYSNVLALSEEWKFMCRLIAGPEFSSLVSFFQSTYSTVTFKTEKPIFYIYVFTLKASVCTGGIRHHWTRAETLLFKDILNWMLYIPLPLTSKHF